MAATSCSRPARPPANPSAVATATPYPALPGAVATREPDGKNPGDYVASQAVRDMLLDDGQRYITRSSVICPKARAVRATLAVQCGHGCGRVPIAGNGASWHRCLDCGEPPRTRSPALRSCDVKTSSASRADRRGLSSHFVRIGVLPGMTRDEFDAHIQIAADPIYAVGFRAGLVGKSKRPPYEAPEEREGWDDGWELGRRKPPRQVRRSMSSGPRIVERPGGERSIGA